MILMCIKKIHLNNLNKNFLNNYYKKYNGFKTNKNLKIKVKNIQNLFKII